MTREGCSEIMLLSVFLFQACCEQAQMNSIYHATVECSLEATVYSIDHATVEFLIEAASVENIYWGAKVKVGALIRVFLILRVSHLITDTEVSVVVSK